MAINWSNGFPGAMHDLNVFRVNFNFHNKTTRDIDSNAHTVYHPIIFDKGYIGAQHDVDAIIPTKKNKKRELTEEQEIRNKLIAEYCIIVENYFGRVQSLFSIKAMKFPWGREKFDVVTDFCFSLTNRHIELHPLR